MNTHLDPISNSVGLLVNKLPAPTNPLMEDEVVHFWLPLGKRMAVRKLPSPPVCIWSYSDWFAGDYPVLPAFPASARVVNVIASEHSTKMLHKTTCIMHPVPDPETKRVDVMVRFEASDGLVDFQDPYSDWFLAEREVDSYECF